MGPRCVCLCGHGREMKRENSDQERVPNQAALTKPPGPVSPVGDTLFTGRSVPRSSWASPCTADPTARVSRGRR